MIQMDKPAAEWFQALPQQDSSRMQPILDLFEECVPRASAGYYGKNILTLMRGSAVALALSPRKNYISFYPWSPQAISIFQQALPELGKVDPGVGCLRFRKPQDINMDALRWVFTALGEVEHSPAWSFK